MHAKVHKNRRITKIIIRFYLLKKLFFGDFDFIDHRLYNIDQILLHSFHLIILLIHHNCRIIIRKKRIMAGSHTQEPAVFVCHYTKRTVLPLYTSFITQHQLNRSIQGIGFASTTESEGIKFDSDVSIIHHINYGRRTTYIRKPLPFANSLKYWRKIL